MGICCSKNKEIEELLYSSNQIYTSPKNMSPDLFLMRSPTVKCSIKYSPIYPSKCLHCSATFYNNKNTFCSKECKVSHDFEFYDNISSEVSYVNSSIKCVTPSSL